MLSKDDMQTPAVGPAKACQPPTSESDPQSTENNSQAYSPLFV
jgi:hypothetical protein